MVSYSSIIFSTASNLFKTNDLFCHSPNFLTPYLYLTSSFLILYFEVTPQIFHAHFSPLAFSHDLSLISTVLQCKSLFTFKLTLLTLNTLFKVFHTLSSSISNIQLTSYNIDFYPCILKTCINLQIVSFKAQNMHVKKCDSNTC